MKKLLSLIISLIVTVSVIPFNVYADGVTPVKNEEEFIKAVKSDTKIILTSQSYSFDTDTSDFRIVCENINNLEIVGAGKVTVNLSGFDHFMKFSNSSHIRISNITFSTEKGEDLTCVNGRFMFSNCQDIVFSECEFKNIDSVFNGEGSVINVEKCEIDSAKFSPFMINDLTEYNVNGTTVKNCVSKKELFYEMERIVYAVGPVMGAMASFNDCRFENNNSVSFTENSEYVNVINCIFYNNEWQKKVNISINTFYEDRYFDDDFILTDVKFSKQEPVIKHGRTLVPVADVLDILRDIEYEWDDNSRSVKIKKYKNEDGNGGKEEILTTVVIKIGESFIERNDKKIPLDVPSEIINGKTMLPLRAVMEALGMTVGWDELTNSIVVNEKLSYDIYGDLDDEEEKELQKIINTKIKKETKL